MIGYNSKGYPEYHFLDYFEDELDAYLCIREYNNKPYDIYVDEKKYSKIIKFMKLPSKILIKTDNNINRSGYTFKQVYEEWKEINFPTAEEIKLEEETHKKTPGKLGKSSRGCLQSAFNNSVELHDRIFSTLRRLDFQKVINTTEGSKSKKYDLQNLYHRLDEYAEEMEIVNKTYSKFVNIDVEEDETNRHVYTYDEIKFLWSMEGNFYVDILLILLYCGMRIEELLSLETKNIFFDEGYMIGGLKTEAGKNRIVPIHHKIRHIIEHYYNSKNKYLFVDKNSKKIKYRRYYDNFTLLKEEWKDNFDVTHVVHETRHTVNSEMDRHGANKKCRELILGHKSLDTNDRIYNHKEIEELKETIELITYEKTEIYEYKTQKKLSRAT